MIYWALPLFWLACATAGYVYALQQGIPSSVVLAALPAFLLEATLFLTLGIESWRKKIERLPPVGVAALLVWRRSHLTAPRRWPSDRFAGNPSPGSHSWLDWFPSGTSCCRKSPLSICCCWR